MNILLEAVGWLFLIGLLVALAQAIGDLLGIWRRR